MTTQFAIPKVGSKVRVTTRFHESRIGHTNEWRDLVDEGIVIDSYRWSKNSFNLHVPLDKDWAIHEISIGRVIDIEYMDGQDAGKVDVSDQNKVIQVTGSKGEIYTVTKVGSKVTCSCPGFGFRKKCKHTEMIW